MSNTKEIHLSARAHAILNKEESRLGGIHPATAACGSYVGIAVKFFTDTAAWYLTSKLEFERNQAEENLLKIPTCKTCRKMLMDDLNRLSHG